MKIRAEEISQILKDQIKNYDAQVSIAETGTILSVGDGIARIYGLKNAMAGELLDFPGGLKGMVLNLEEDNVGAALFGDDRGIKEGDTVKSTGEIVGMDLTMPAAVSTIQTRNPRLCFRETINLEQIQIRLVLLTHFFI